MAPFASREEEAAWLQRMTALEEERGDIIPNGASGGGPARWRRETRLLLQGFLMPPLAPASLEHLGQVVHASHQRGAQGKVPEFPDHYVPPPWEELQEHERACYRDQAEAVVDALVASMEEAGLPPALETMSKTELQAKVDAVSRRCQEALAVVGEPEARVETHRAARALGAKAFLRGQGKDTVPFEGALLRETWLQGWYVASLSCQVVLLDDVVHKGIFPTCIKGCNEPHIGIDAHRTHRYCDEHFPPDGELYAHAAPWRQYKALKASCPGPSLVEQIVGCPPTRAEDLGTAREVSQRLYQEREHLRERVRELEARLVAEGKEP